MALLTDRTLAQSSAITPTTLIHIVTTGDTSQNSAGSSYKAELGQLSSLFSGGVGSDTYVTGFTYTANTFTIYDNSGNTYPVTINEVTGLTVNGDLSATTISATTYLNLPGDIFITGGTFDTNTDTLTLERSSGSSITITGFTDYYTTAFTYTANTFVIYDNSGNTFPVTINEVTGLTINGNLTVTGDTTLDGLTATTISASTYLGLPIDVFVTGGTYSADTITFTNNSGGTFDVTGITFSFTGGSGNCITDLYVTNLYGCSPITVHDSIQSTGSTASGILSFAFGDNVTASGDYSHAKGSGTTSVGNYSYSKGFGTVSQGTYSHAEGRNTTANGSYSHSEGENTQATGAGSHSEGFNTNSSGGGSHAEGFNTNSSGPYSHAEGISTNASNNFSHAEGSGSQSTGVASHAEGDNTKSIGQYSHSEGSYTKTGVDSAFSTNSVTNGLIILNSSYGDVTGYFAQDNLLYLYTPTPSYSIFTISAVTFNSPSTEIQLYDTSVSALTAYVGDLTYLSANNTFDGDQIIPGPYSHSEGNFSLSLGPYSHAEGNLTQAVGTSSHSEGFKTRSYGLYSHSEGSETITSGQSSHAEGDSTQAIGTTSHAEGSGTQAVGNSSHAEGKDTIATGGSSHTEGNQTQAIGDYSHAEGLGTIAYGNLQHVSGQYNLTATTQSAFIIGNGTNSSNRSNLLFAAGNEVNISGKTITTNVQITSGATAGYVLTSVDSNGNASWQPSSGFTGGTVSGLTTFTGGLSATTFSATTIGASGNCVTDLYVSNINSCSPLYIQPTNTGDVLIGSGGGVNVGIGTSLPTSKLHIVGSGTTSSGFGLRVQDSSNTNILTIRNDGQLTLGYEAGAAQTNQIGNNYFGYQAGKSNTGTYNTLIGHLSSNNYVLGSKNVFLGSLAGAGDSSSDANIAIGYAALYGHKKGSNNIAIGENVLGASSSLTGSSNIAIGFNSMSSVNSSSINIGIGNDTLSVTSANRNTAIGHISLKFNTTGEYNTAVGFASLSKNTTGIENTAIGDGALSNNTTGIYNVGIGVNAGNGIVNGSSNIAIGKDSLNLVGSSGNNNISIGSRSLYSNTTGSLNIAIGGDASLYNNSTGVENVALGYYSGQKNNGSKNVFIGTYAGSEQTASTNRLFIDNQYRTNATNEENNSLIVGTFHALPTNQILRFNSKVGVLTSPTVELDVSGKTKTISLQVTSGATTGYVLTSDASGNGTWQPSAGFTGNTSATCITDLYVNNLNSCSPLNIQPTNAGDVLIGTGGTVNVGIGISSPTAKLHINNTTTGNTVVFEDDTNPDFTPFIIDNNGNVGIGSLLPSTDAKLRIVAGTSQTGIKTIGLGNGGRITVVDSALLGATLELNPQITSTGESGLSTNGNFPIILAPNNDTNAFRLTTAGNVGINTTTPSEKLDVSGKTKTISLQVTSGATNGYVLTSDSSGNGTWQPLSSISGSSVISVTGITTSAYTATTSFSYYGVEYTGATSIQIPSASGITGFTLRIKDERGTSETYPITITPATGNIDGNPSVTMSINYMSLTLVARNNNWWII